jgi:outer membrane protein TolC
MKYLHRFYLFFLIICLPKLVISQKPLLDQYIDEAIQQNLVLKQKNIPLAKSRLALKEAEKRFKPSADFSFSYTLALGGRAIDLPIGDLLNPVYSTLNRLTQSTQFPQVENVENQFLPNDFYDGRVRISYPIFNKDLLLQKEVRIQEIQLQENEIEIYKKDLILAVKMAYYQYGLALESQKILANTNNLLEKSLQTVQILVREGKAVPSQILRAENEITMIQSKLKEAEYNVDNARLYLKFLLNRENEEDLSFEKPGFIIDKLGDVERINYVSSNPVLNKITLGLSIQSLMEKRNQQYFMPQISLFSDIGSQEFKWQFNRKSVYIMGGLQLSMPLWTNKINKIKGEQIQLDIKALQSNKELIEQQDKLAIDVAKNKLLSSKAAYLAMEKQVSTSATYLRLTEKAFQNGTVSLLEMYDAQNQYTTALLQENVRYFQFLMALADLQKLI